MIRTSLLENHGVMCADKNNKAIKYSPEKSVVKLKIGDEIKLNESAFVALFKAFFAEIEAKFVVVSAALFSWRDFPLKRRRRDPASIRAF